MAPGWTDRPGGPPASRPVPHFPPLCATSGHHSARNRAVNAFSARGSVAGPRSRRPASVPRPPRYRSGEWDAQVPRSLLGYYARPSAGGQWSIARPADGRRASTTVGRLSATVGRSARGRGHPDLRAGLERRPRVLRVPGVDRVQAVAEVVGDAEQVVARADRVDPAVVAIGARIEQLVAVLVGFFVGLGVGFGGRLRRRAGRGARRWAGRGRRGRGRRRRRRGRAGSRRRSRGCLARLGGRRRASRWRPRRPRTTTGLRAATGISIPPRWTTNPNEIPALSMRMSSAASVARGTAAARRGRGGSGKASAPREVARAVGVGRLEADELLLARRLRLRARRSPRRRSPRPGC